MCSLSSWESLLGGNIPSKPTDPRRYELQLCYPEHFYSSLHVRWAVVFSRFQRNRRVVLSGVRCKNQEQQLNGQCVSDRAKVEWGKNMLGKEGEWDITTMNEEKIVQKSEEKMSENKKRKMKSHFLDRKMSDIIITIIVKYHYYYYYYCCCFFFLSNNSTNNSVRS